MLVRKAVLVRRNVAWGAAAALTGWVATFAALQARFYASPGAEVMTLAVCFGAFFPAALAAWLGFVAPRRSDATLEIQNRELRLNGRPFGRIRTGGATLMPDGRAQLDLHAWPGRLRLEVEDVRTARMLLAALGLDRRDGTSRFRVRTRRRGAARAHPEHGEGRALPTWTVFLGIVVFLVLCWFLGFAVAGLGLLVTPVFLLFLWLRRRVELTIGADGFEVRPRWARPTFVGYGRVRSVERVDTDGNRSFEGEPHVSPGFAVALDDGTRWVFDTREPRFRTNAWAVDPIYDALRAARAAAVQAPPARAAVAPLARGDRSQRQWIGELRALAKAERSDYRTSAIDARGLFELLADPSASRELRAAAAVALGASHEHAPKLRIAADDVADAVVRRVAVAAADADDARIEEAVEEATKAPPLRAPPPRG